MLVFQAQFLSVLQAISVIQLGRHVLDLYKRQTNRDVAVASVRGVAADVQ